MWLLLSLLFCLVFHNENPNISGMLLTTICNPESLLALMFRKLRQLGPVVVLEKEAVCWRGIFEQNKDPKWQPFT